MARGGRHLARGAAMAEDPLSHRERPTQQPSRLEAYRKTRGLQGKRVILPDVDSFLDKVAEDLVAHAIRRVSTYGIFHLAVSAGPTMAALYQRLMIDPRFRVFPWRSTHLWLTDDAAVDADDERSTAKSVRELLADHAGIDEEQVHPIPANEEEGARRYEEALRERLAETTGEARLDHVLVEAGADGHVAALFPHTAAVREPERWAVVNDGAEVPAPRPRVTLALPGLRTAHTIQGLITGQDKHAVLQHISLAPDETERFPLTGLTPAYEDGELTWYIDHPAAIGPATTGDETHE